MRFYTYVWCDPKDKTPRYVGKGCKQRVWVHIERPSNTRYSRLLSKRHKEGYICIPKIIWVNNEAEALELEILLIAAIGREDLGKGTLFNLTDGGDGVSGYRWTKEARAKRQ